MQAWIDDSGAKGQRGYITLGGLLGEAREWAAFSEKWADELRSSPSIRFLSTSDAANFNDDFHKWPLWQRDAKVRRLTQIVNDFHFTLVYCSIDLDAFEELVPRVDVHRKGKALKRVNTLTRQPYFHCFHTVCSAVCYELLKRGETQRFEIFFDEQDVLAPRVREWYPIYKSLLRPEEQAIMPLDPLFRDDKENMPLQIADFIAWVVRADQSGKQNPFTGIAREMRGLTRSDWCQVFDRERLQEYANALARNEPLNDSEYERTLRIFLELPEDDETGEVDHDR